MIGRMRAAFTLVECTVAIVLLAILGTAVTTTVQRQGRAYRAAAELSELRDQLSEGAAILASELRALAPGGGDVYPGGMGKNALEFRSAFGFSIACEISGGSILSLPSNSASGAGTRLTWLYKRAEPGNGVYVFDEGSSADLSDDAWVFRTIVSVVPDPAACAAGAFAAARDALSPGFRISLSAALPGTVGAGAPVRFVERVRYALYRSSDNRWYLGYCASSTMTTTCAALQPVSGPYLPPASSPPSAPGGLDFHYVDANGTATTDPLNVARIDIALRGVTYGTATLAGRLAAIPIRDSVRLSVEVRNR